MDQDPKTDALMDIDMAVDVVDLLHVVIVDDHPLFREGVAATLAAQPGIAVVGEGASADEAVRLAGELLPDVILLDVSMPGGGLAAARRIAEAAPVVKVVMLTVSEAEEDVTAALRAGARAYVLKGVSARELVAVLRAVAAGDVYVTPSLAASLLHGGGGRAAAGPAGGDLLDDLTARERQILEGVAAGDSNKEIAHQFGLSEKTVKHHMTNILQKLQVRNRVEAALLAQAHERRA
jgi:DNA-binding NarL/FixJ family response regulator